MLAAFIFVASWIWCGTMVWIEEGKKSPGFAAFVAFFGGMIGGLFLVLPIAASEKYLNTGLPGVIFTLVLIVRMTMSYKNSKHREAKMGDGKGQGGHDGTRPSVSIAPAAPLEPKAPSRVEMALNPKPFARPLDQPEQGLAAKMLFLGCSSLTAENYEEAHRYFSKCIEEDPVNVEAWLGKGIAAGGMSRLNNLRVPEIITSFENAIAMASPDVKSLTEARAASNAADIVKFQAFSVSNHRSEFRTVSSSFSDFIDKMSDNIKLFDWVLPRAQNKATIGSLITAYHYSAQSIMAGVEVLPGQYRPVFDSLNQRRNKAIATMRQFDSSYMEPEYLNAMGDKPKRKIA